MTEKPQKTILILDDEDIVLKRLKPALEKNGYSVETFSRSQQAFDRIMEKNFDIIITDLKMDGLDGMQFLTLVKEKSPKTEVIVITGFATMETAKESFQKGVFDFLSKPFKIAEIIETVKKADAKLSNS